MSPIRELTARNGSPVVSLPTMLVGFGRYSRDQTFSMLARNRRFVVAMAVGSVAGVSGLGGGGMAEAKSLGSLG